MKKTIIVTATPSPDDTFARAMSITPERETEIDLLMDKYHGETSTYPDALAAISAELTNANELAYVSFHLGAFAESQRTKHELLNKLLGD
jgi:hypothetical protein